MAGGVCRDARAFRPRRAGAAAARFTGKAGQVFEAFVERDGAVVRLALAGAGDPADADRLGALERAGAALAAKYRASGETALQLDLSGAVATPEQAAAVLLGLRLRGWRHDAYRTTLPDDQKATLDSAVVSGAGMAVLA